MSDLQTAACQKSGLESRPQRDDWTCDVSQSFDCLSVTLDTLQVACRKLLQSKKNLEARVNVSNRHFQDTVTDLIIKINEYADSSIAGVRVLCHDRAKVFDAQADELAVSAGQITACAAAGKAALDQGRPVSMKRALLAATGVQQLCWVTVEPRVSAKLNIAADVHSVSCGLGELAVLRRYDVDGSKSVASGTGLVSCFRGLDAVNEVNVSCVNSAGEAADWVTAEDVLLIVRNDVGKVVGRRLSGKVIGKGEIVIKYEVDDVDADDVKVSVSVGGVTLSGGPWRVAVMRSAVRAEAVHVKTNVLDGTTCNLGVAVTLDGLHLAVSNYFKHSISVYCTDTGCCISTFGKRGSRTGQFNLPYRICATPRGTILVCEYGNKRLQEVTIAGEHVRFLGEGHFDNEGVYGMCMQGDVVAVGKYGGNSDGRIVLFRYSRGALMRKFGSYGAFGEGRVKDIRGLSFTPDGRHILVAQSLPPLLSLFTVDGVFVTRFGCVDDLQSFWKDVLCSGTSVFVVDSFHCRVCAFSAETGALIRSWGTRGEADGQFMFPFALAAHRDKLYVLDMHSPRVQVFE